MKAAVIGVGAMGRNHARIYNEIEATELMAVADVDRECAERAGRIYGARAYTDYREMLDREQPDLLSVAVPTLSHLEVALAALDAGCHILVEKPLARTVEEGRRIVSYAARKGLKLAVGHVERFNPAVTELKQRLEGGELGKVFQVIARRLGPFPSRIRDVGVAVDLATHDLDIMRHLIGARVVRVYAEVGRGIHPMHEDLLLGLLKFENGVVGVLEINWLTPTKVRELSVTGERGMFVLDYLTQDLFFYENDYVNGQWHYIDILRGVSEGKMMRLKVHKREPLRAELASFAAAVLNDEAPEVSGEEGLRALALAEKLIESGRERHVVWIG